MSHAFSNGKPDLVASDLTRNNKSRVIYETLVTESAFGTNYDGHVVFDNQIGTNYRSYELYQEATLGYNLCSDCSACDPSGVQPEISVPLNPVSRIDLTDVSDNIAYLDDAGNWIVDPSNNLIPSECHENVYAHARIVTRWDSSGNNTDYNYLHCYDFPAKVNFTPPP